LVVLLLATGALYLWGSDVGLGELVLLRRRAGRSESWKAFFFGLFSWSMLVPRR
jgi:hypothetical protein